MSYKTNFENTLTKYLDYSRSVVNRYIEGGFSIEKKSDKSLVTEVDIQIEKELREIIEKEHPTHSILGEEFGLSEKNSEYKWILDPIDGTLSFSHGLPLWGTLISLTKNGQPVVSAIDLPGVNMRFSAFKGEGAYLNNKKVTLCDIPSSPSSFSEIEDEIISISDRANFVRSNTEEFWNDLHNKSTRVRTYSDCFGHALSVTGSVGAMVDMGIKLWDISSSKLLVEEAGGRFEILQETPSQGSSNIYSVVMGKPSVVSLIVDVWKSSQS